MITSQCADYLAKAQRSLLGAESELEQKRFDNAVNRAYYACFQAAVAALIAVRVPVQTTEGGTVSHKAVRGSFTDLLIRRRKLYPVSLARTLQDLLHDRIVADYQAAGVSATVATTSVHCSRVFVREVVFRLQDESSKEL
jgi:uncharacterized protein (UPF0332 family)